MPPGMTFKHFLAEYSIQIQLPEDLTHQILTWGDEYISDQIVFSNNNNPWQSREDDPHITILYRLNVEHLPIAQQLLDKEQPFAVKLGKVSLFSNEAFDVVKIDVVSEQLHNINSHLVKTMAVERQYPQYVPHVTIAFIKKNEGEFILGNEMFMDKTFEVNNLYFSSRNGTKIKMNLGDKNEK